MLAQMLSAFVYGIVAAGIRIKCHNIAPFMVFHLLWDMMLISSLFVHALIDSPGVLVASLEVVLAIIILVRISYQ